MADESTFRALLTAHAPLVALVPAARIWDQTAPTNTPTPLTLPYILLTTVSSVPENYLGDPADLDDMRIQVDVFAADKASAKAIQAAVRAALASECFELMAMDLPAEDPAVRRIVMDFGYLAAR